MRAPDGGRPPVSSGATPACGSTALARHPLGAAARDTAVSTEEPGGPAWGRPQRKPLGSPRPHLHRDWAHPIYTGGGASPAHICAGTGLSPPTPTSAPGLCVLRGGPSPLRRRRAGGIVLAGSDGNGSERASMHAESSCATTTESPSSCSNARSRSANANRPSTTAHETAAERRNPPRQTA
jgi:hypothetical protein